jgi:hypothetical protein
MVAVEEPHQQKVGKDGTEEGGLDNVNFLLLQCDNGQNEFHGVSERSVEQGTKVLILAIIKTNAR